jgi:geranylgeranyl diphosphate synthase type I
MTAFAPSLERLTELVDDELGRFLASKKKILEPGAPLIDEVARMLAAGGKRLRPAFCYWGYRAAGAPDSVAAVAAASSLELLHTFALVHDDIMDRSDERRGIPTTFAARGTDFALLAGDLALVLADAALMESGFPPERLLAAFAGYSRMRQEVIAGQFLDVEAARKAEVDVAEARRIAVLKSGRYSIEEPMLVGAALAGAPDGLVAGLAAFGGPLGEAFQLRDDLLGTFGDRSSVGKPVDSDIREGKRHVLFAYAAAHLDGADRQCFLDGWGRGDALVAEDVEELRDLLVRSGARAYTEDLLEDLRSEAGRELARLGLPDEARAALEELARRATDRQL